MRFPAGQIRHLCRKILLQLATPQEGADIVSAHLTDNDLMGVRSHGVLRMMRYIDQIDSGYIDNKAEILLEPISDNLLRVDGCRNFGILAFHRLIPALIDRARASGIAGGAIVNCAHTGRIGAYTEIVARQFMLGTVFGGGGNAKLTEVAPFGGAKGVFDTNPYAASLPIDNEAACTMDFATSATAQGKLLVYRTNKTPVPDGWIIDKGGRPTTSVEDFYAGGAMLPSAGAKGYGLAMIAELFGDAVLGRPHELNWFMTVVDIGRFVGREPYMEAAGILKKKIEECPPLQGFERVMWPGQPELRRKQEQSAAGIDYSEDEMTVIASLAERFNIEINR